MSAQECHEEVTRNDMAQPCDKRAVGYRLDPEEGTPYPVCRKHLRADIYVPTFYMVLEDYAMQWPEVDA